MPTISPNDPFDLEVCSGFLSKLLDKIKNGNGRDTHEESFYEFYIPLENSWYFRTIHLNLPYKHHNSPIMEYWINQFIQHNILKVISIIDYSGDTNIGHSYYMKTTLTFRGIWMCYLYKEIYARSIS